MRHGAGPGLTREDHLEISAQLYGIAARARQAADLAEVVGEDALSPATATTCASGRRSRPTSSPAARREPLARRDARPRLGRGLAAARARSSR